MVIEGFRAENQMVLLAQESFISAPYVLCLTSAVLAWYNSTNPLQTVVLNTSTSTGSISRREQQPF